MRQAIAAIVVGLATAGLALLPEAFAAPPPASMMDLEALRAQGLANVQRAANEQDTRRRVDQAQTQARIDEQAREIADLKAAFQKLASNAFSGDKTSGQALRNFADNKLGAGLDSVEAGAAAATSDAAERWRQAGALAKPVDPRRALMAYEKAFSLDQSDFWTCVYVARLRDDMGNNASALVAARAAEKAAKSQREMGVAAHEVGARLKVAGDYPGARAAFQRYLDVSQKLAAADPGSRFAQRDVSIGYAKLGDVALAQRDLVTARKNFELSLAIYEKLAAADPGSTQAQRDLSIGLERLGDLAIETKDYASAKFYYTRDVAICEKLAALKPNDVEAQRDVWASMWRLADIPNGGVSWNDVLTRMEAMKARGVLLPPDEGFLNRARANAKSKP